MERKALLVHLLMEQSSVRQKWIVEELRVGSAPNVSRSAREVREKLEKDDRKTAKVVNEIARFITGHLFTRQETAAAKSGAVSVELADRVWPVRLQGSPGTGCESNRESSVSLA